MSYHRKYGLAALALLATALGGASSAHANVLATGTRTSPVNGTAAATVPLTDAGATAIGFSTKKANTVVVITYNAECYVTITWLSVTIAVDGVAASPAS